MSKNIVICCDGTGNTIRASGNTNVFKLYQILTKDSTQRALYITGVGTIGYKDTWLGSLQYAQGVHSLATGSGLDKNVIMAYKFLCDNYNPGDNIWLFGFSRGAYSMLVLAAFAYVVGLMSPDQKHLAGHAFTTFKKSSVEAKSEMDKTANLPPNRLKNAYDFGRSLNTIPVIFKFVGLWDPVASVIVPQVILPSFDQVRFTNSNSSIKIIRLAAAVDERRRWYRLHEWLCGQNVHRDSPDLPETPQDFQKVWFAGCHSDVGGGNGDEPSISRYSLNWMIEEARQKGLRFDTDNYNEIVKSNNTSDKGNCPNETVVGSPRNSMNFKWKLLELIPKKVKWLEWPSKRKILGFYLPLSEPRYIDQEARIHWSTTQRTKEQIDYRPPNLLNNGKTCQEAAEKT